MTDFGDAVIQLVLGKGDVNWPLSVRFDDAGLDTFIERWLDLKPPPS